MADNSRCPLQVFQEKLSFASHPKSFSRSFGSRFCLAAKLKIFLKKAFHYHRGCNSVLQKKISFPKQKKSVSSQKNITKTFKKVIMSTIAQQFGMTEALEILGIKPINEGTSTGSNHFSNGELIESYSPVDGQLIGKVKATTAADYEKVMQAATTAFKTFRAMTAPQRGEIVRQFGNKLRELKEPLGKLVSYEMGKSLQEGYGEVQEMIDICDFAVGLSRQLNGQTIP